MEKKEIGGKTNSLIVGSVKTTSGQYQRQTQLRICCYSAHLEGRIATNYIILAPGCIIRRLFIQASDPALFGL